MDKSPIIKWNIVKKAQAYKGGDKSCRLSLADKLCILEYAENKMPNQRITLISKCGNTSPVSFTTWLIFLLFYLDCPNSLSLSLNIYIYIYIMWVLIYLHLAIWLYTTLWIWLISHFYHIYIWWLYTLHETSSNGLLV